MDAVKVWLGFAAVIIAGLYLLALMSLTHAFLPHKFAYIDIEFDEGIVLLIVSIFLWNVWIALLASFSKPTKKKEKDVTLV